MCCRASVGMPDAWMHNKVGCCTIEEQWTGGRLLVFKKDYRLCLF